MKFDKKLTKNGLDILKKTILFHTMCNKLAKLITSCCQISDKTNKKADLQGKTNPQCQILENFLNALVNKPILYKDKERDLIKWPF